MPATDSLILTDVSYTALNVETLAYKKCNVSSGVGMIFSTRRR
jgi:hypothetical protein